MRWWKDAFRLSWTDWMVPCELWGDPGIDDHPSERLAESQEWTSTSIQTGRTYGSTRGTGNSYSNATGSQQPRNPTKNRGGSIGSRPISNERPTREAHASGRIDSINWNHSNQGTDKPSDSDRREDPEHQTTSMNDQTGFSRDASAMATAFKPLNRSLETFSRGCLGPMSAVRNLKGCSRNPDARRMNLTVV